MKHLELGGVYEWIGQHSCTGELWQAIGPSTRGDDWVRGKLLRDNGGKCVRHHVVGYESEVGGEGNTEELWKEHDPFLSWAAQVRLEAGVETSF